MKRTIIDLWNGEISPITNCGNGDPEIDNLVELIERNCKNLENTSNESQKETLEKYVCCVNEYLDLITEQAFCDGFCLSSKLLTESLL